MASRKKLTLVGAQHDDHTPQSPDFAKFLDEWLLIEARLQNLYEKQDAAVREKSQDNSLAIELRDIQLQVEQDQRDLLRDVAAIPANNAHDIIAKLEIWKSMIIPDGCDPALAQPSDQIVYSVLSDLISRQTGQT